MTFAKGEEMNTKAEYEIVGQAELKTVRVKIRGDLDSSAAHQISDAAIEFATAHEYDLFLFDMRDAILTMTTFDSFQLPRDYPGYSSHRIAVLIQEGDDTGDWDFLETVQLNVGKQIRLFTDEQTALDWLI